MRSSRINVESFEFHPREYVTHYCNERDVIIWKEVFDAFDTDEDGLLVPRDLLEAMSKYNGYHPKNRNFVYHILALFDKDESGSIDFREFLKMLHEKPYERDTPEDIKKVFNEIDQDFKGYLDEEDLRNLAIELKEEITEEEIKIIMKKLDPKKTGRISLETFMEFNREKIF